MASPWLGLLYNMVAVSQELGSIAFYNLTSEVTWYHCYHILLVKAVTKIHPISWGGNRDSHLSVEECQCHRPAEWDTNQHSHLGKIFYHSHLP